jgi:hypothetical protein
MPQCSVPGCHKQGGHKFPLKNKERLVEWLVAIKREEAGKRRGKMWKPGIGARVCSDHFDQNDYKHVNSYGMYATVW